MSALQTGGGASPPGFEGSLLPGAPHQRGAAYQSYLEGRGEGEGVHTYRVHTYLTKTRNLEIATSDLYINKIAWTLKLNLKVNKKKTIYLIVPQQYDEVKNNFFLTPLKVMGSPPVRFS